MARIAKNVIETKDDKDLKNIQEKVVSEQEQLKKENAKVYLKPVEEKESETIISDKSKKKIYVIRKYKNGVVKQSLKSIYKKGKKIS